MTYLLWISYKGTRYAGFQVQPNAPTVCAVLQDAMQAVFGCRPDVKGCSRTDAGVHARRFALSFCYTGKVPMQKIVPALNAHLPPDIRAVDIRSVPDGFHARYAAHAAKLADGGRDALREKTEWVLHSIACRAAIKAGDRTNAAEMLALAQRIMDGTVPPFCPHGRPCVLKITRKELEKQFGRLV